MKKIRLQAHRGVSTEYPENTLSAFKAAVDEGYDIIELDTKYTSDDVCVILHDKTVGRTGRTVDGLALPEATEIKNCTFKTMREWDFGIWKDEKFRGEKIPTIAETLLFAAENNISLKFDNVWETYPEHQQELFLNEISEAALGKKIIFTCRNLECLKRAADMFPDAEMHWDGPSDTETLREASAIVGKHRLSVWLCYDNDESKWYKGPRATRELCDKVRAYGKVGVWKLSTRAELMSAVNKLEVDIIETNGHIKPFMLERDTI